MASGAQGKGELVGLLRQHNVTPSKRFGQNFLVDPNTIRKIVDLAAVGPDDRVLEVGAGTGTLTRELAKTGAQIVAYEIDPRLQPILEEVMSGIENVELRFTDAVEAEFGGGPWTVVANLPYNLAATLVLDWLVLPGRPERFVVMVQREVADRFTADPGSRVYGLPSVVARLYGSPRLAFRVPATVFYPQPDVDSAVVEIVSRTPSEFAAAAARLAAAAFGQRRKMLRRSLADALADPAAVLTVAGIDPAARPEDLTAAQFLSLAESADG